ncbi:1,2-phenylacetyl-CoA epoxidase subunit PaaC [Nocardioides sp.]|uniref:1,2-phenylacetyl-CoA epoxidase subunit PaaC n=1 Tax=Nocardioides sp. TaxID=35761 RepID=UPI00261E3499|nr:1,2-phenylacetyl-CoA epoxidase subunit PaaC [Nocardioides sp.]MCW2739512.1 Phenylacetate-CoA oxygenase, PaaI subunit [Nocardioides sp.]
MDSHIHLSAEDEHDSAYTGLLVNDAHWAFGTDFEDPLAGVDTSIPEGTDAPTLAAYALMLGDDSLVMSHRISEWTSNAPDLEDDIALSNIALDLLGQARLLLARAAKADASVVPALPEGSPAPPEDALAYFREAHEFRNVRLAEVVNGDFAEATVRVLLFSVWRLAVFERLRTSRDHVLSAVAAKGVKELAYHRDYAARWFVTLAQGTEESRSRLLAALESLWPLWPELFDTHPVEAAAAGAGVGVDPADVREDAEAVLDQVLTAADVTRPGKPRRSGVLGRTGRDGMHGEALSRLLAEMQSVARAHPRGLW